MISTLLQRQAAGSSKQPPTWRTRNFCYSCFDKFSSLLHSCTVIPKIVTRCVILESAAWMWRYLTTSMDQNPSWESARLTATCKFPNISWNPKVHYFFHKSSPLVHILRQMNPVYTTPFYFSKIHFNTIISTTSGSSYWSLSFSVSHQNPPHALPTSTSLTWSV
jgi:hypothetical protein